MSAAAGAPRAAPGPARTIVFAHANGFPAGTYAQLFARWRAAGFVVHAIDKLGHDARYATSDNWPMLAEELVHFIEREAATGAMLVGHSLGGFLSVLAAVRRPELAQGIVLLDSPIIAGWRARALQFGKAAGLAERLSPAHVARRRRTHWPSRDAAEAHFAAKPAFAAFGPGVLADYVAAGMVDDGEGVRLAFDRDVETAIYTGLPHHLASLMRRQPLHCPVAFVGGSRSDEVRRVGLAATRRLTQGRLSTIEGSHLFPFERPAETADAVLHWINAFGAPAPSARRPRVDA